MRPRKALDIAANHTPQHAMLAAVAEYGPIAQADLVRSRLDIDAKDVVLLLNQLQDAGLGVLVYLRLVLTISVDSVDSRLVRYGYPAGHGTTARRQAAQAREAER